MSASISVRRSATLLAILLPLAAHAANPVSWPIAVQINRADTLVVWNSPTAIDLGQMVWEYDYNITKVTGTVSLPFGGSFTQDITGQIDPADRIGSGETRSLPTVLLDETLADAGSGTTATARVEVLPTGFGRLTVTNIMLGSVDVPLFGSRPIQRINLEATVGVTAFAFGDYTRDGVVNGADYTAWQTQFTTPAVPLADGDGDALVTAADFTIWRDAAPPVAVSGTVPEPTTIVLAIMAIISCRAPVLVEQRPGRAICG
jgi:hypothetical protein